jgi:hypothetical protein
MKITIADLMILHDTLVSSLAFRDNDFTTNNYFKYTYETRNDCAKRTLKMLGDINIELSASDTAAAATNNSNTPLSNMEKRQV